MKTLPYAYSIYLSLYKNFAIPRNNLKSSDLLSLSPYHLHWPEVIPIGLGHLGSWHMHLHSNYSKASWWATRVEARMWRWGLSYKEKNWRVFWWCSCFQHLSSKEIELKCVWWCLWFQHFSSKISVSLGWASRVYGNFCMGLDIFDRARISDTFQKISMMWQWII